MNESRPTIDELKPCPQWLIVIQEKIAKARESGAHYMLTLYDVQQLYWLLQSRQIIQCAPQINHETHVFVPREPTKEMVDAGERMMDNSTSSIDVFKAMIAAAPKEIDGS